MTSAYFGHRNIDSELSSLRRNLQMKRSMGYGLTHRDIARLHQLEQLSEQAKKEELIKRVSAEKRKRETRASFPKKLTVNDIATIFHMFNLDQNNLLSGTEFCSMVASLLHVRNGAAPTQQQTMAVAKMLAKNLVYQQRWGYHNAGVISLNDFVHNAVHGDVGRLISEAHQVSKDVVGSLKAIQIQSLKTTADMGQEMQEAKMEKHHLQEEADDEEEDQTDEEDKSIDSSQEEEFHDCCDAVDEPTKEANSESESEESNLDIDSDIERTTEESSSSTNDEHKFQLGEMLIFKRPQDESCRTVKVVELIEGGKYAVEHEVETTANHIVLVPHQDRVVAPSSQILQKGSQVVYKKEFEARVLEVGSAYTFDEEGRPSYLIAVKTITDESRLSRENC